MNAKKENGLKPRCQCSDLRCPGHPGKSECFCSAFSTLYRIDQTDLTGTRFCMTCGDDAMAAGVYTDIAPAIPRPDSSVSL